MTLSNKLKSELDAIVAEVAQVKNIRKYEVKLDENVQVGDGFVGHFYMAEIVDTTSRQTIQIAIKKTFGLDFDLGPWFKNEIIFYNTTYAALAKLQDEFKITKRFDNVPVLISSGLEPKNQYMVMENLKAQGFGLFPKEKYLDQEHLKFIFDVYGRFHALSFVLKKKDYETFKKVNKDFANLFGMLVEYSGKAFEECTKAAINALDPDSAIVELARDLEKYIIPTFVKSMDYKGQYSCSTHGDCWSNNMMFKYSETGKLTDMKLVDFQLSQESSPIHDLSYFFYSGASKTDLDILEDYLKIYHKSFSRMVQEFGEDVEEILPYSALVSEWKDNALFGMFMGLYLWQIKLAPKENYAEDLKQASTEGADDALESMMKLFAKLLLTVQSEPYKERAKALLTHACEFGVLSEDKIVREEYIPKTINSATDTH